MDTSISRTRRSSILHSATPWVLGFALGLGAVNPLNFGLATSAYAAEVQPAPKGLGEVIDVVGRGLASKADENLKAEVGKYARQNLFKITGDLIPSGDVSFVRGGLCNVNGRVGAVLEFKVHARAKIDVGTRKLGVKMVRKVWGVDTVQTLHLMILPKQREDGSLAADISIEIVSATATPEREAKQSHADDFRNRVSDGIKKNLAQFTGERDLSAMLGSIQPKR